MQNGFGGVVAFETHNHDLAWLKQFVERVQERGIIASTESLASPETILSYPLQMSHRTVPPEDLANLQINAGFFRLSLGFEDAGDLIADLHRGLQMQV